jgi:hypothetical protein
MAAQAVAPDGTWLTLAETGAALRLSATTIWRMFGDGDLPGFRACSAHRIPAAFVADAIEVMQAGGQIDIREFGRQWSARSVAAGESA